MLNLKVNQQAPKRRRKSGPARRAEIAEIAGDLFATDGFQVSTRKISAAVGITQAALYKHYSSKEELIEEVFKGRFPEREAFRICWVVTHAGYIAG